MRKNIRIDTDYLQKNILSSFTSIDTYLAKSLEASKEFIIPNNFIYKKDLNEIKLLLEKYNDTIKDYENLISKNINEFNDYHIKALEKIKNITDITIKNE